MKNRRVEIGVVADLRRQTHGYIVLRDENFAGQCLGRFAFLGVVSQRLRRRRAQGRPVPPAHRHQRIQGLARACAGRIVRRAADHALCTGRRDIEDHVADGDADLSLSALRIGVDPEGQILDREIGTGFVCAVDPACQRRIVRFVQLWHSYFFPLKFFCRPCQQS